MRVKSNSIIYVLFCHEKNIKFPNLEFKKNYFQNTFKTENDNSDIHAIFIILTVKNNTIMRHNNKKTILIQFQTVH